MTAETMHRYLIWNSGPGPLDIEFKRVGEAVLRPSLLIVTPTGGIAVPHQDDRDIARFHLGEAEVARLLSDPGTLRAPCLAFQCDAFLSMASARRRWGWSIRVSRDGETLCGHHLDGEPLAMRRDGFTRARLRQIPEKSVMARGHDLIGLS
ncbi:MAG: hypothetical protein C0409_04960 [Novosphingobium sp.]|nr:hypothetical protein [Novosphingobium sp.]